ncbi:tubulin-like doman-containing protein [Actinocrispum wychmicini]|uniref:Tubulin-like protein n=1 Tax=Actinocrispum wychmicini TaxID=1213861 RepID=A0A4R2JAG5_9PSEU|nr:tubulin-like doman-containing protein [Actinocrispum wychmicini]TCO52949.1 tubulin-like protein [Actinocrispum wychmicini]
MQIYQPMLFVGLGGTGCRVGAELERRLREELCGPDGTALQAVMQGKNFLPYQLPSCLQFVYADMSEDELGNLERRIVPDASNLAAAERTMHMVRDLVPQYDTYPEVARSLRLSAAPYVDGWLPPPVGEPRIGPLSRGAGQLPTIGRAALFETFRAGLAPAQGPLLRAIGNINNSLGELAVLGGGNRQMACDVFVAFSVAGGTGSGLFYDYLHLIGDAFARNNYRIRIFPLVLMPSAFEDGLGGGRAARLNAGRALLDLFRLVDDQNAQVAGTDLDAAGVSGTLSVRYPDRAEIRLRAATVQTGFLFSMGSGVRREDLHRSVVSLMLSLIGTDLGGENDNAPMRYGDQRAYMSFADSFINSAVEREAPAPTGIGNCGVSTGSVASMTVPVDDIADIISSRLLAHAVTELATTSAGRAEDNTEPVDRFFTESNLDPLRLRAPLPIKDPAPAQKKADNIINTLATRARRMESALRLLEQNLVTQVPELVQDFDPHRAVRALLADVDPFRLHRVLQGEAGSGDDPTQLGFVKIVASRRGEPAAPAGLTLNPPNPGGISDRVFRRAKWGDPKVTEALRTQDKWYEWRAKRAWHAAWAVHSVRWDSKLQSLSNDVTSLVGAFREHARDDERRFRARSKELYQHRVGVTYLLSRQGDLDQFYYEVIRRFVDYFLAQGRVRSTATAGDLVTVILGGEGWRQAWEAMIAGRNPAAAVGFVRDRIKRAVKILFHHRDGEQRPLLPPMQDLLAAAAGRANGLVADHDVAQFREKLAGLVPGGFAPSGTGRLRILFSYPAATKDVELERYLEQVVKLPRAADTIVEFRPITAETIAVVLFRSSMGLTEVPEVREVLKHWSDALRNEQQQDFLRWRQRLGHDFGYLATTGEHRERILHHLLCAVWNDQVHIAADDDHDSPGAIAVGVSSAAINMRLQLRPYGRLSSWASVLAAYEEWVLTDDEQIRRDLCAQLISGVPDGVDRIPRWPSPMFERVMKLPATQLAEIDGALADRTGTSGRTRLNAMREFWAETFPNALRLPFRGVNLPIQDNLADLYDWLLDERLEGRRR